MARNLKTAWLVTWEPSGEYARVEDPVVAVFNYRWNGKTVRSHVEQIYAALTYSVSEKAALARSKRNNPYPAQYGQINGVPWEGEITCGHNPWLYARLVNNLHVEVDAERREVLLWDERPRPRLTSP